MLNGIYPLRLDVFGVIEGDLSISEISSFVWGITFLSALCKVNNIRLTQPEMIMTAKAAQTNMSAYRAANLTILVSFSAKTISFCILIQRTTRKLIPTSRVIKLLYKIAIFSPALSVR